MAVFEVAAGHWGWVEGTLMRRVGCSMYGGYLGTPLIRRTCVVEGSSVKLSRNITSFEMPESTPRTGCINIRRFVKAWRLCAATVAPHQPVNALFISPFNLSWNGI